MIQLDSVIVNIKSAFYLKRRTQYRVTLNDTFAHYLNSAYSPELYQGMVSTSG